MRDASGRSLILVGNRLEYMHGWTKSVYHGPVGDSCLRICVATWCMVEAERRGTVQQQMRRPL